MWSCMTRVNFMTEWWEKERKKIAEASFFFFEPQEPWPLLGCFTYWEVSFQVSFLLPGIVDAPLSPPVVPAPPPTPPAPTLLQLWELGEEREREKCYNSPNTLWFTRTPFSGFFFFWPGRLDFSWSFVAHCTVLQLGLPLDQIWDTKDEKI